MRHQLSGFLVLVALCIPAYFPLFAGDVAPAAQQPAAPATGQPVTPAWVMPADERRALDAVVERAIAAGVPDPKGGTFLHGKVTYQVVRGSAGSTTSQKQTADGLHLRLADGRLLLNLRWLVATSGDGAIDISGLQEITPDKIAELGTKHPNFARWNAGDSEAQFKKFYAASELPMLRASLAARGLVILAMGSSGDLAWPSMVLLRMNVPDAEFVAISCAMNALWNEDGTHLMEGRPSTLTLVSGDQGALWQESSARMQKWKNLTVPAASRIVRLGIAANFMNMLMRDQRWVWQRPSTAVMLSDDQAAASALRMLDDNDVGVAQVRADIKRLRERAAIPETIAATADLPTILTWWNEAVSQGGSDENAEEMLQHLDQMPAEHRQVLITQALMARLRKAALGDLVALVGDERTSRWVDHFRARTVGDNALRALAIRLGVDPRVLIERDPKALWTAEERTATFAALTTWWATNRDKPMAELLAGALGLMPLPELANLLKKSGAKERGPLLADIAKRWTAQAPKDPEPTALGVILFLAKESKLLDPLVAAWPVAGRQRSLLAAWHLEHGNAAPFDRLLADTLNPPKKKKPATDAPKETGNVNDEDEAENPFGDGNEFSQDLHDVLRIAARHPAPDRLTRLMMLITNPAKDDDGARVFASVSAMTWGGDDGLTAWWGGNDKEMQVRQMEGKTDLAARARAALPLVLNGLLLGDQRPASKTLAQQYAQYNSFNEDGEKKAEKKLAEDLRLADIAAVGFPNQAWNLGLKDLAGEQAAESLRELQLDLTADKATRDQVIAKQRAIIAAALPLALKAANLPTAIPGLTDAAPTATGNDAPVF